MRHQNCAKAHAMKTLLVYPQGRDTLRSFKSSGCPTSDLVMLGFHGWYQRSSGNFTVVTGFQPDGGAATCQSSEQMNILTE